MSTDDVWESVQDQLLKSSKPDSKTITAAYEDCVRRFGKRDAEEHFCRLSTITLIAHKDLQALVQWATLEPRNGGSAS